MRSKALASLLLSTLLSLVWAVPPALGASDVGRGRRQLLERERRRARAKRRERDAKRAAKREAAKAKSKEPPRKKWIEDKKTVKAVVRAVKGHVSMKVADEGSFRVRDEALNKTWELKLKRVHDELIARLDDDHAFVCADFRTVGEGPKRYLDLDLFASREGEDWFVDKVVVHKVEGKARFTYNDRHERLPLKARKRPSRAKSRKKTRRQKAPRRPR